MCGINGVLDLDQCLPDKAARVRYMNSQMIYRGPDDEGLYNDDQIALGMRRLSIIDVGGGHQPLFNENHSLVLVANGEIYNYVELMCDLKARGHVFATASDVETILHLYEEKGVNCLADLRGMFAFILWDRRTRRLFAARDRVGIKFLYFAEQNGVLWLSSELKTIVGAAQVDPKLRDVAVYQFLLYGFAIDQRHTVVEQVERVLPGEYLLADSTGITRKRYWTPIFSADSTGTENQSDDKLREILANAVSLHLRSDVPVGILLSGGVDSSSVAAYAAQSGGDYTALCAGYLGTSPDDERQQAHATAMHLGLPYEDVVLDASAYSDQFDQLVQYCDEPVGDWAAMPQWALYAQAQQRSYKVLLSGIGGDEVFYGYPFWNDAAAQTGSIPLQARNTWTGYQDFPMFKQSYSLVSSLVNCCFHDLMSDIDQPLYELRESAPWGPDAVAAIMFGTYLIHNGCFLSDRLGMGCSVEVRVPLLDHVLVESVFALPLQHRFREKASKILLKKLLRGRVPDAVLDAPKRGFTPPMRYLEQLLASSSEEICNSILTKHWLEASKLRAVVARQNAMPWLNRGRVRQWLGIPRSSAVLFRILAFQRWFDLIHGLLPFDASGP